MADRMRNYLNYGLDIHGKRINSVFANFGPNKRFQFTKVTFISKKCNECNELKIMS